MNKRTVTHCKRGHEFTPENTYVPKSGGSKHCRTCKHARHKANPKPYDPVYAKVHRDKWNAKNPDYFRNHWLKRAYGLTPEQYSDMLEKQKGLCASCEEPMIKVNIDHNHTTGGVRELLCTGCNTGIGSLCEDVDKLRKAIAYLERHNA